ncbi:hypothetical protein TrVE_jg3889 [Triparma verrucosa]|uniref:Uncharacterized protein n=1 Tax=Triparma verrucosa TaxID=1606542 RepID=A0A9W7BZN4_9STRA|nr:hypothetical protein TrVE_jg3889 [Triparma verrucosa]
MSSFMKSPSPHQLSLLIKNVSKSKAAKLSSLEVIELRDLKNSVDELTWSNWLAFARTEKVRKKKKKEKKEIKEKEKEKRKERRDATRSPPIGEKKKEAISIKLPDSALSTSPTPPSSSESFTPIDRGPTSPKLSTAMQEKVQLRDKVAELEEALAESLQKHHEMTLKHDEELNLAREQSVDVLEELAMCKEKLNGLNDEYDLAQNMSNLFTPKQAAETAIRQNNQVKSANWRMVAIRAAFLRLRHAESAADSACASASAMQTFVQHSVDGKIKRAPGMQQVLTALSTAADAQSQFRIVAGGAAKALEPLMDVGPVGLDGIADADEGSIWASFLREDEEKKEEIEHVGGLAEGLELSSIVGMASLTPAQDKEEREGGHEVAIPPPPPAAPKTPEREKGDEGLHHDSDSSGVDFNASSSSDQDASTSEDEEVLRKKALKKKRGEEEGGEEEEGEQKKKITKKIGTKKSKGANSPVAKKKKSSSSTIKATTTTTMMRKKRLANSPTSTKKKTLKKEAKSPSRERTKHKISKSARDLLSHASGMRSDLSQLRQAMSACMCQVDADLMKLKTSLATVMCKVLDKEVEDVKVVSNVYDSPSRVGSIFSPAPTPKPKELSRRNKARLKQKMDGGVRICAHVALPSASLHKSKNTPSTATSNVRISGNNVELGMIKENDLELLRVDFSRVFAYHHGGNVEAFFNRNVTGEVRPWVRNAVRGEGPGVVVVLSVGVGGRTVGSKGSASMSTAFLEGEEGDTGVMYDCIDAVFEEIDKDSTRDHDGGGGENEEFFRGLTVVVTAVEVKGGKVKDLLRDAGGWEADADSRGGRGGVLGEESDDSDSDSDNDEGTKKGEDVDSAGRPFVKVQVHTSQDFNKLVGVLSSVRHKDKKRQSIPYAHLVVKARIMSGEGLWSTVVFADVRVPAVDESVLYGVDDEEEDGYDWSRGGTSPTRSSHHKCVVHDERVLRISGEGGDGGKANRTHALGMDRLHAQEDSAALGCILESRWGADRQGRGGRGLGGVNFDSGFDSALCKLIGRDVGGFGVAGCGSEGSAVRCFVHVPSGGAKADAIDAATGMLFAECARGDVY